jgi:hypothetical protein
MHSVIRFLNARNLKPADIHRQLCEVYEEHAVSDSMVRRGVRHFNEWRENMHDDPRSGRPSVVNEDLVRAVEEKIQQNRQLTISSPSQYFPQIWLSLLYRIMSDKLRFRKLCSRRMPKLLTENTKGNGRPVLWPFWYDVVMLHDNACSHTAAAMQDLIATFGWEQFDHPPPPSTAQTKCEEIFMCSCIWKLSLMASQAASFYDAGIQKLVPRYDNCLNNGGNYVEK